MSYRLTHPDSDQTIERAKEDVPLYLSAGWRTKEQEAAAEKAPAKKTTASKGGSK